MISILTATYNRANLLPRIFESLQKQTNNNFEWIIIDDGSSDNTSEIVKSFSPSNFKIHFFKKENGGKHTALNLGVKKCIGSHILMLDSDDKLPCKAIEILYNKIDNSPEYLAGVVGRKADLSGNIIGSKNHFTDFISNYLEASYIKKIKGDLTEVLKREIMLEFPFPIFKNEKFCPEDLVWNRIAQKYDLLFFNESIYNAEYQEEGLTNSIVKIRMSSPKASMTHYSELASYDIPFKEKIKATINFWRFSFNDKDWSFKNKLNKVNKLYSLFCLPLGLFMYINDKIEVAK